MSDKVEKIKFVSIYSYARNDFICEYYTVEKYQSFHEEYLGFIRDNLLSKQTTEKQSVYGMWRTKFDDQYLYLALTHPTYSERLCSNMLADISHKLVELYPSPNDPVQSEFVDAIVKPFLKPVVEGDKIETSKAKVASIQVKMADNMNNIIKAGETLNVMQEQAVEMRGTAEQFNNKARDLKNMMRCRNIKLWVILGVVVLAVLLYIILPIVIKTKKAS